MDGAQKLFFMKWSFNMKSNNLKRKISIMKKLFFLASMMVCMFQLQAVDPEKSKKVDLQNDPRVELLKFGGSMAAYGFFIGSGGPVVIGLLICVPGATVLDEKFKEDPWFLKKMIEDAIIDLQKEIVEKSKEDIQREVEQEARKKICEDMKSALVKLIAQDAYQQFKNIPTSIDCKDSKQSSDPDVLDKATLAAAIIGKKVHIMYNGVIVGDEIAVNSLVAPIATGTMVNIMEKVAVEKIKISCHGDNKDTK